MFLFNGPMFLSSARLVWFLKSEPNHITNSHHYNLKLMANNKQKTVNKPNTTECNKNSNSWPNSMALSSTAFNPTWVPRRLQSATSYRCRLHWHKNKTCKLRNEPNNMYCSVHVHIWCRQWLRKLRK